MYDPEPIPEHDDGPPPSLKERAGVWLRLLSHGGMIVLSMAVLQFLLYNSVTGAWSEAVRIQRMVDSDAPRILRATGKSVRKPTYSENTYGQNMSVEQLREAALNGDSRAQNRLGEMYATGVSVPRDDRAAAEWFERAALRGLARAQYNLAMGFRDARGVARDPARAVFWYLRAAKQSYPRAQYDLARLYEKGIGVPKDQTNAIKWHVKAAQSGLAEAQYALARKYEQGIGVTRNKVRALEWYRKAALQDHDEALKRFRDLLSAGVEPDPKALRKTEARRGHTETAAQRKARIAEIQTLLIRLNFRPGAPDGAMGPGTRRAIRLYQQFAGRTVDGKPSAELLEELRAAAGTVKSEARTEGTDG